MVLQSLYTKKTEIIVHPYDLEYRNPKENLTILEQADQKALAQLYETDEIFSTEPKTAEVMNILNK